MSSLFEGLSLVDLHRDLARNIASPRQSQDLFDDLTDDPAEWALAQAVEAQVKPPVYSSHIPIIDRPFEDADWFNAITWPFRNWQTSRYSDGSYGVWYGADSVETSVHETAFHWYRGLLSDAGFETETVISERKVYSVACAAALLDLRGAASAHPDLVHASDYTFCQSVGARIHREGHPGLVVASVRRPAGENVVIFKSGVLSNPRHNCQLTYRLEKGRISVERTPGKTWLALDTDWFGDQCALSIPAPAK